MLQGMARSTEWGLASGKSVQDPMITKDQILMPGKAQKSQARPQSK